METSIYRRPLKYQGYAIVLQEVPDEITLAFNISGCPYRCPQCHSKHLWEYTGNYLGQDFDKVLSEYKDYISCVCFMGGDYNINELHDLCKRVKELNLKTAIYSGADNIVIFEDFFNDHIIDYIKVGPYDEKKGGLDKIGTNQSMYIVNNMQLININSKFRRHKNFT